jgi:hypothetical protein
MNIPVFGFRSLACAAIAFIGCLICLVATAEAQPTQVWTYNHGLLNAGFSLGQVKIAVDPSGVIHMCNDGDSYSSLVSNTGLNLGTFRLGTQTESNRGVDVGYDDAGDTVILTTMLASPRNFIRVSKNDSNGNTNYNILYTLDPQNPNLVMRAKCMTVEPDGTAIVAGYAAPAPGQFSNMFVAKVTPAGTIAWSKTWDGPSHQDDVPVRVSLDPLGGIYVAVEADTDLSSQPEFHGHMVGLHYSDSGDLMWIATVPTNGDNERTRDMDVAANGDIVLVGDGANSIETLAKIDSTGTLTFASTFGQTSHASKITLDSAGNIYTTGQDNSGLNGYVEKWSKTGIQSWRDRFNGPAGYNDMGVDVKVDGIGNVYVVASCWFYDQPSSVAPGIYVFKYGPGGALMWPQSGGSFFSGGMALIPNTLGYPTNLYLDGLGGFLVGGRTSQPTWDAWVGKFSEKCIPSSLSFAPGAIVGSGSATGTVTMTVPAPPGGVTVGLSCVSDAVQLGTASVFIPEGKGSASFGFTASNSGTVFINAPIKASVGEDSVTRNFPIYTTSNAAFVGQTVPSTMTAGESYSVSLQFQNTGNSTWTAASGFRLISSNPLNNITWGVQTLSLFNGPVAPGQTGIFSGIVFAPTAAGTYNFKWQPAIEGIGPFGQPSTNLLVTTVVGADAARFVSKSCPTTVLAGNDFAVSYTMKNVGSNTWTAPSYSLRSIYDYWRVSAIPASGSIAGGAQTVFTRILTAPISPGTYSIQWGMYRSGFFGDKTPLQTITVAQSTNNCQFQSQTVPTSVAPGANFNATLTFKNLGSATWGSSATVYALKSQNPSANTTFGTAYVAIPGTVAPGQLAVISHGFTAPSIPGTYHFQWRMTANTGTGASPFGQYSTDAVITVLGDGAQFVSRTGLTNVAPGQNFIVSYTMKNIGTTTWSPASGYAMTSMDPQGNTIWGGNSAALSGSVAPGATTVVQINCIAPVTPGIYPMQWKMASSGVLFGDATPMVNIAVSAPPYASEFISQSGIPTTVAHGASFTATIKFKNTGSATWASVSNDYIRAQNPAGNVNWGLSNLSVPSSVGSGGTATFTHLFTAPMTPGTYHFMWRLYHDGTSFGQYTTDVAITVT